MGSATQRLEPNAGQMWERACSRMRWVSQRISSLIHRIREQARSHREFAYIHGYGVPGRSLATRAR